jgi:RNA polymerase sigma factor (sigma-70 family)
MDIYQNYQNKLFPYAYNILGSSDDAMDAIQDVVAKFLLNPDKNIENKNAYLIRSVINQSINIKKRNQKNIGNSMWLPEPVSTEKADSNIERKEIISYSMLLLLEKLNPKERAVFILKEAFDYSHQEIADVLSFSIENSRKLLSRAKKLLEESNLASTPSLSVSSDLLHKYINIIKNGDVSALEQMLSADIRVKADGGGKIKVVSELTIGIKAAIDLILYVYQTYQKSFTVEFSMLNHQPALLFYNDGKLINCQIFELEKHNDKIRKIYSVVDPGKLKNKINF